MSIPIELVNAVNNISVDIKISYVDGMYTHGNSPIEDAHIHDCCEIYVNLAGDVSFLVENALYPIQSGDIILTKPNEMHHCVYNSNGIHRHFCLWIKTSGDTGDMLSLITNRKKGEGNLISMSDRDKETAFELCKQIYENFENGKAKSIYLQADLYTFLALISKYEPHKKTRTYLPESFEKILLYIDNNLSGNLDGNTIADKFYISRSTLYRMFKIHLNMTPAKYIEAKRLSLAKDMLEKKGNIQQIYSECGFNDYSHFIAIFKKRFGITPYKYTKNF